MNNLDPNGRNGEREIMNTAYHNYLENLIDLYKTTPKGDDVEAIRLFLDWAANRQPVKGDPEEPSVNQYATAAGAQAAYLCDDDALIDHHVNPDSIRPTQKRELLGEWADRILDMMCDDEIPDLALDDAFESVGISRHMVSDNSE